MDDTLTRIAQHRARQVAQIDTQLDQLIADATPDQQVQILRTRIHELERQLVAAKSSNRWLAAGRPTLINLTNFGIGLLLGASGLALVTSSIGSRCFY